MNQPVLAVHVADVKRVFLGPAGEVVALQDVDLRVAEGTMVAVRGRSGSGKTTLLNLIGALDQPTSGSIEVFGERVDELGPGSAARWRAHSLGFVFQAHALMPSMTAHENVELGLRIAGHPGQGRDQKARTALIRVGLADRMDHRPQQLSGGQRQRVAVARAIATGNPLILADEPTAGLDTTMALEIIELLRSLVDDSGVTIVMATHDPLTDSYVDAATHLENGVLVTDR